jgi:thiol-disulfide isomerase/thioredoxin
MQKKWVLALVLLVVAFMSFYLYRKFRVAPEIDLARLQLEQLDGTPYDISTLKGKKSVLCFSASWCGPCRKELDMIASVKSTGLQDVEVIVVSDEPVDSITGFMAMSDAGFTWLRLPLRFSQIGIHSIPTSYLINKDGRITEKTVGFVDWKDPGTIERCRKLLDKKI